MASVILTFLGGAGTVTGSKYLIETGSTKLLVDCGLFQGDKHLRELNWSSFPIDPASLSCMLLTHAHMDHCGYLPRLVKHGFNGPIWATDGTKLLSEIVLRDSAHLQEQDARDAAKGGYSKHEIPEPLYTVRDVEKTMSLFRFIDFHTDLDLGDGLSARYVRSGHILGSASIQLKTDETSILFSGDLGRSNHPVLRTREIPEGATTVLIESTYGDREHPDTNPPHGAFAEAIRRTVARKGSILIPAFAVDRTEILLKTLAEMKTAGRIPDIPIYVNSPMGVQALRVYLSPSQADELRPDLRDRDFINLHNVHEVTTTADSIKLNRPTSPCIIISSSGMATGGRVLHHLEKLLPDPRNTIIFTGYQAHGTRGHRLITGDSHLKLFGRYIPVRAEVMLDQEFSVHADASELLDWLSALDPKPATVYCVHGEQASPVLAERIRTQLGITAVVPSHGEKVRL